MAVLREQNYCPKCLETILPGLLATEFILTLRPVKTPGESCYNCGARIPVPEEEAKKKEKREILYSEHEPVKIVSLTVSDSR